MIMLLSVIKECAYPGGHVVSLAGIMGLFSAGVMDVWLLFVVSVETSATG